MQLNYKVARFFKRFGCSPDQQVEMQHQIDTIASKTQHGAVILSLARQKVAEVEVMEQADLFLARLQTQVERIHPLAARLDGVIAGIERSVDRVC